MRQDAECNPLDEANLERFRLCTHETCRHVDSDRQDRVNNAVFSILLGTGRVEFLYIPDASLAAPGRSFVIARLAVDASLGAHVIRARQHRDIGIPFLVRSLRTLTNGAFRPNP